MENTFEQIRKEYEQIREKERLSLAEYLKEQLKKNKYYEFLSVKSKGLAGKGRKDYTNHNTIPAYNLENWKWVEINAEYNTFNCIVSLNMIDIDQQTGNFHALYDRIGIIITSDKAPYKKQICTDLDLPLNDEKRKRIFDIVVKEYDLYARGEC